MLYTQCDGHCFFVFFHFFFPFIYTIKVLNLSVETSMEQSLVPSTFLPMCSLLLKEHTFVLLLAFGNSNFKPV